MQVKTNDCIMNSGQKQEEEEKEKVDKGATILISVLGLCLQT